jgi:hypothetical protein
MKQFFWFVSLALLAILLLGGCAAVSTDGNRIVAGGEYVLRSGETLNGNLLVLGGNSTLEQGSRLNGSLNVIGGTIDANGEIVGDIWVAGGNIDLGPNALVRGSAIINGGNLDRAPGAQITGGVTSNAPFVGPIFEGPVVIPVFTISPWMLFGWLLVKSLLLAMLAAVVVMILPEQVKRTARAVVEQPIGAGLVGLAVMLLAPIVLVLFAITIIGIPVTIVLAAALIVAVMFGWIALGVELGQRLDDSLKLKIEPVLRAALGTFVLVVVVGAIDLIPIIGWLATAVVSAFALGGVALTRFGTRAYTPTSGVKTPPALPQGGAA